MWEKSRSNPAAGLLWCIILWLGASAHAAPEEDAVKVFKQLKPSVVSISCEEGSGSGILLQEDGLILTNAHVVNSPMPFEVAVDAEPAAGRPAEPLVYKKVQIVGYHPRLDLALVRINPKEHPTAALKPVSMAKDRAEPGQRVYVIGNPGGGGKILTKSITSGMISAVDREVEGEKYYQTDAAINPGNSGGPMCDRNGSVLGLVTFKFTDVQSIAFAIPLQGLDTKGFVALTQRVANQKLAKGLLDRAGEYGASALKDQKTAGSDSEKVRQLFQAARHYAHEALSYDPANAEIYYNLGVLYRIEREPAIAAAYFARAIQLSPWHAYGPDLYHELGWALMQQKQTDKAAAVWSEGVTKFPNTYRMWGLLAFYYSQHERWLDAGRSAATALLLAGKDANLASAGETLENARKNLAGAAVGQLQTQTARPNLIAMLDRMAAASNAAREARSLYMTSGFLAVIALYDAVPVTGIAQNIPQEPLKPVNQWALASADASAKPADAPPAPSTPQPASTMPPTAAITEAAAYGWVDLLPKEPTATGAGTARRDKDTVLFTATGVSEIKFPYVANGSYGLGVEYKFLKGSVGGLQLIIPAGSTSARIQLGSEGLNQISIGLVNNKANGAATPAAFVADHVYTALIRVVVTPITAEITVTTDGCSTHWKGPLSALSAQPNANNKTYGFRLYIKNAQVGIKSFVVHTVTGTLSDWKGKDDPQ